MGGQQSVGAVVLAAGESRRFGSAKQLAVLDGRTLLEHVLALAGEAGLAPIAAVVPVWLTRPPALTMPKSVSFTSPRYEMRMLAGETSRWTISSGRPA